MSAFTGVRNSCVMLERNLDFSSSARRRFDEEVHEPFAGVSEGIPDDFRHGRRNARLFREVEGKGLGQLRRPLASGHDVLIVLKCEGECLMHHLKGAVL